MKQFPKLKGKAILSPMAGVTDVAFRALCKRYGAALTCTEFIHSTAIVRENARTMKMLEKDEIEKPVAIQLFGKNFEDVVSAGKIVQEAFDIVDINCGCPAWKVIKTGAGSELLKEPEGIRELVKLLVENLDVPVTVKIRKGINEENINAVEVAKIVESAGAAAISIHGRTQKQGYSGKADWDIIKKVKLSVKIPVIGNGDVFTPEDFKKRLEESGVDYILVARGAIGNPYIFKQINDYLETGKYDNKDKIEMFFEYLELAKKHGIEFKQIKSQAVSFTKGLVGGSEIRRDINAVNNLDELEKLMNFFKV